MGIGEKKAERQFPNKADCLGDPSVSDVGERAYEGKMARRIVGLGGLLGRRKREEWAREVENEDPTRLEGKGAP